MDNNILPNQNAIHKQKEEENQLIISYLKLRRWVGYLGIALPIMLIFTSFLLPGCYGFQNSISDYHNTISRDVFVGMLCSISLFLFAYKGYGQKDNWISTITGILGFCVAIFPTRIDSSVCTLYPHLSCNSSVCYELPGWVGTFHLIVSAIFLLLLGYFSYFLFTISDYSKEERGKEKRRRNRIYRTCGVIIALCVITLITYFLIFSDDVEREVINVKYKIVLILEWVAVWAFGFSWAVKGEAIGLLNDK